MSQPVTGAMPETLDLPDGYVVTWDAVNPTTWASVAGVKVSSVSIFGENLGTGADPTGAAGQVVGPYMLVPGPGA